MISHTIRHIPTLFLFFLLTSPAAAQKGEIVFDETKHDFGVVFEGEEATHTFTFRNEGNAPLSLISVNPSCGCTTPEWSKEAIAPGESGTVMVSYDSHGRPGPFHKSIAVNSDGEPMQVILRIEGDVHPQPLENVTAQGNLLFEQYASDLGEIEVGQTPSVKIRIQNGGDEPLSIKNIRTPGNNVSVTFPSAPISANEIANVTVSINTESLQAGSRFNYDVEFETDDQKQPVKKLHLEGTLKSSSGTNE